MYRNYKYYLARDVGRNLFKNNDPWDWMSRIIWYILMWLFYAFIGFIFIAGCGMFRDGHYESNNTESYPGEYEEHQEAIKWERETGKEEIAKFKNDQYQLEHNPDHQIH